MPNLTINVSQKVLDTLSDLVVTMGTNWTKEELVEWHMNDTFEDGQATVQYMHDAFSWPLAAPVSPGACGGSCSGKGLERETLDGACPNPCDTAKLDKMDADAKKTARLFAIRMCMDKDGANCICTGGTYYRNSYTCKQVKAPDGSMTCTYRVSEYYQGGQCVTNA